MIKDIPALIEHLKAKIVAQTDVAVIGLSGGADSTLVAILCMLALGKENVVGVHMPYDETDTEGTKFNARSVRLARKLEIVEKYVPIANIADAICESIGPYPQGIKPSRQWAKELTDLDEGNARARARMCVLYGLTGLLSHQDFPGKRIQVAGTGNLSEDLIGFFTKQGDSAVDFSPLGGLFKSEVYQLLNYFRDQGTIDEDHIDRVPSPGLWFGHTAEGELGYKYNDMEPIIRNMIPRDRNYANGIIACKTEGIEGFIQKRYWANRHKLMAPPIFDVSEFVD